MKLTKAQQAIEDRIMAQLSSSQQFEMSEPFIGFIFALANNEIPKDSSEAFGLISPSPSSLISDLDVTPKPDNVIDAVQQIVKAKTAKKTARGKKKMKNSSTTASKSNLPQPITLDTVVKKSQSKPPSCSPIEFSAATSGTKTIVKPNPDILKTPVPEETPLIVTNIVSSLKRNEISNDVGHVVDIVQEVVEVAIEPESQIEAANESTNSVEESASPVKISRVSTKAANEEATRSRSKRSLAIGTKETGGKPLDLEIASPAVRRSRLSKSVEKRRSSVSLRSSKLSLQKKEVVSEVPSAPVLSDDDDVEEEEEDNFEEANENTYEEEGEENEQKTAVKEIEPQVNLNVTRPVAIAREDSQSVGPEAEKSPERAPSRTRTKPVTMALKDVVKVGPEAVEEKTSTRTKQKKKPSRAESRNAGPEQVASGADILEQEKSSQQPSKLPTLTKQISVTSTSSTHSNASTKTAVKKPLAQIPTSAQKPRIGTPMKGTATKKPMLGHHTTSKTNLGTPLQKSALPTTGVPFGSGGAPAKPKLQSQTATKVNLASPMHQKMPIAMGLTGAIAVGKVAAPNGETDQHGKYGNLVSGVMSFMPQTAAIHSSNKYGTSKLASSSTSTSALHHHKTAMGLAAKSKVDAKTTSTTNLHAKTKTHLTSSSTLMSSKHQNTQPSKGAVNHMTSHQSLVNTTVTKAAPSAVHKQVQQLQNEENMFNSTKHGLDSTMAQFDVTRFDETYTDYPIDDLRPPCDDDDDEDEDLHRIPDWAQPHRLNKRIAKQTELDDRIRKRIDMDEDKVSIEGIEEALLNPHRRMRPRTSSQHWTTPPLLKNKQPSGK